MASKAGELVPFSPQWTQQLPGGSRILDENLAKIKKAIDDANATIIRQQTEITRLTSIVNVNFLSPPQKPGQPVPSMETAQDEASESPLLVPGLRGPTGLGLPGMPGSDGEDGDVLWLPGPPGRPGQAGTLSPLQEGAEDPPEAAPLIIIPPRDPFVLHLGYGPTNFSGTLPVLAESIPHFWLHPYTSMLNVSPISVGSTNDLGVIEWEVGGPYTRCDLDVFVRSSLLSNPGAVITATVTKNGVDTTTGTTITDTETDQRHSATSAVSFVAGDLCGIHLSMSALYTSGSLLAHFIARLS